MDIEVKVINSFSINGSGGNPAGLVIDANRLSPQQKQLIAFKAGLSETAFFSNSSVADYKVEFFTPTKQIPHCGHATIAAFSYLKSSGLISKNVSSKETVDGTRQILFEGATAYMQQLPAEFSKVDIEDRILSSLGIDTGDLDRKLPIVVGNAGNRFLLVPINNESKLKNLKTNFPAIQRISVELDLIGYYVFSQTSGDFDAQARMFAPAFGIEEESATGMAAGPLGAFLHAQGRNKKTKYIIGQGSYMSSPSPSRITVHIDPTSGNILAGGDAYVVKTVLVSVYI